MLKDLLNDLASLKIDRCVEIDAYRELEKFVSVPRRIILFKNSD